MSDFTPASGDNIDKERSHAFDGITEYDNNLPRWWVWTLYISIAVAIGYVFHFHFSTGVLSKADVDSWIMAKASEIKPPPVLTEDNLRKLSHDPERIAAGKALIPSKMCMTCHGPALTGLIGPNLTDKYSIYGSSMTEIIKSISEGRMNNVMPGKAIHKMTDDEIISVACYIADLARQGEKPGMRPQAPKEKEDPITY